MNLTKQSRELMLFFSKNKHINYDSQTNKTKTILRELYNEILEAHNYCKKHVHYRTSIKKILSAAQITKPLNFNSNSFPEMVRNHIDESMMSEISFSFSLYDRNIKVHFIVENSNVELDIGLYNRYMESITMWLYMLNIYGSKDCVNSLTLYFYFTSLEKSLPNSNIHILNEINVNTAWFQDADQQWTEFSNPIPFNSPISLAIRPIICGTVGIQEYVQSPLEIYPNPSQDFVHIEFSTSEKS
jgi:hypothetical protein